MIFKGYNVAVNPNDLDQGESPDCMNVRPYKGRLGFLAPRPGYAQIGYTNSPIIDMVPFNLATGKQWVVTKNDGSISPLEALATGATDSFTSAITFTAVNHPATSSTKTIAVSLYDLADYAHILVNIDVDSFLNASGPPADTLSFRIKLYPEINGVVSGNEFFDLHVSATPSADGSGSGYGYAGPAVLSYFMIPSQGYGYLTGIKADITGVSWPSLATGGIIS